MGLAPPRHRFCVRRFFDGLNQTAIGAQDLPVDPSGRRADQEGDDVGNVLRLAEAFQWRHPGEGLDLLFAFAVQEQLSGDRAWSDCVDGDVPWRIPE